MARGRVHMTGLLGIGWVWFDGMHCSVPHPTSTSFADPISPNSLIRYVILYIWSAFGFFLTPEWILAKLLRSSRASPSHSPLHSTPPHLLLPSPAGPVPEPGGAAAEGGLAAERVKTEADQGAGGKGGEGSGGDDERPAVAGEGGFAFVESSTLLDSWGEWCWVQLQLRSFCWLPPVAWSLLATR